MKYDILIIKNNRDCNTRDNDDDCDNRFHPIKDRNDDDKNFS